jgi:hypothetical protein
MLGRPIELPWKNQKDKALPQMLESCNILRWRLKSKNNYEGSEGLW